MSIKWQKSKNLAIPNAGLEAEEQELSFIADGSENDSHFGRRFVGFLQS